MPLAKILATGAVVSALTVASPTAGAAQWRSTHFADHPLVGKIWSVGAGRFVSRAQLENAVSKARFLLLGETHTNVDHHLLQAQILERFARSAAGRLRLVVEMIPQGFEKKLADFRAKHHTDTKNLGTVLQWKKRGWGDWRAYKPIFDVAYKYRLGIVAGNLDTSLVRSMARGGVGVLGDDRQRALFLNEPYSAAQRTVMLDLLFESHCKLMPRKHLAPMLGVQQARDGKMAAAMLAGADGQRAALIAGAGHVRRDLGVPRILRRVAGGSNSKVLTISFQEVTPDHIRPQQYELKGADSQPVFDYIFFTPVGEIRDHCAELAKRFGKSGMKKKPHGKFDRK